MRPFHHPLFWLLIGWFLVGGMIYLSLTSTPIKVTLLYGDKLGHMLAYTLLMSWFVQLYQGRGWLIAHALFLLMLGASLEFLQDLNGRYFEYADMVANAAGVLLGSATLLLPWRDLLLRLERRLAP